MVWNTVPHRGEETRFCNRRPGGAAI